MCGISVIIRMGRPEKHLCPDIHGMTDIIQHRGPDDEGYVLIDHKGHSKTYCGDNTARNRSAAVPAAFFPSCHIKTAKNSDYFVALGHRRLSIVDPSAHGHQPMASSDGQCWLVFNGEIYNYREIASELKKNGVAVSGTSDTEVLLQAYLYWGKECIHRFNGMFAFFIVDLRKKCIFAARDRFGIKPLYYLLNPKGTVSFASEIKQFTVLPGWQAKLNPQRGYDYLAWGMTDHTDETLFKDVRQFRPGEALYISLDDIQSGKVAGFAKLPVYKWYTLEAAPFSGGYNDAEREFRYLLSQSVDLRLRSDVPVGTCLSGGLDSSSIVVLMNERLKMSGDGSVSTFSACSEVPRFDERKWIDIVVNHTGAKPHYVCPDLDDLLDVLPDIAWHQDEPFTSTSIYAQWSVFRMVSKTDVKVILDGQGADEQLAGYKNYFGVRLANLLTGMRWLNLIGELRSIKRLRGYSSISMLMYMADNSLPGTVANWLRSCSNKSNTTPAWLDLQHLGAQPVNPSANYRLRDSSIRAVSHAQLMHTNLQKLLRFEDRNSMAHSIEARVPFMDHNLVEFLLGIPDEYKLADGVTKRVLRDGLKGTLPEPIRMRMDKLGFETPEEVWLRGRNKDKFLNKVKNTVERSDGILTGKAIERCKAIFEGKEAFSRIPWTIISFGAWLDKFDVEVRQD